MTVKSVAEKARVKPGTTIALLNAIPEVVKSLGLPDGVSFVEQDDAQLVFLFVRSRADLEAEMPRAAARLRPAAVLWVFFRKGSKGAGLDMNRDSVWGVAERLGMRPLGLVSVDDSWSAFRLRNSETAGR